MLELTETAAEVVRQVVAASPEVDEGSGGLRLTTEGTDFHLGVAALPGEDDHVVESEGARVFLEPEAAQLLDDKILDASVDGDRLSFMLAEQGET